MKHLKISITGRVQGVWFRKYTEAKAKQLGIQGFVKNQPDGSVYVEAEAEGPILDSFIAWCHVGSPLSHVKEVTWEEDKVLGFDGFKIV